MRALKPPAPSPERTSGLSRWTPESGHSATHQSPPFRVADRARSSSRSTYMNERQLSGSEKARANGHLWVFAVLARRLVSGDHGRCNRLIRLHKVCTGCRRESAACDAAARAEMTVARGRALYMKAAREGLRDRERRLDDPRRPIQELDGACHRPGVMLNFNDIKQEARACNDHPFFGHQRDDQSSGARASAFDGTEERRDTFAMRRPAFST